jgi:DNA-binding Lrp family transcriptional regulator
MQSLDKTDRRILIALDSSPRATVQYLSQTLELARGTVQSRLEHLLADGALREPSSAVLGAALGLPLRAMVTAEVDQSELSEMITDISRIPEVVECVAISGDNDLMIQIVARDSDHVYDITQRLMICRGILRTSTTIVLRELMSYRMAQLLS